MSTSSSQLFFFKSLFEYSLAVMSQSAILELTSTMSLSLSKFDFSASAHILKFAPGRAQNRVLCERLHMRQWVRFIGLSRLGRGRGWERAWLRIMTQFTSRDWSPKKRLGETGVAAVAAPAKYELFSIVPLSAYNILYSIYGGVVLKKPVGIRMSIVRCLC